MHSQLGWNLSNTYQSSINSRFLYASSSINRYLSQVHCLHFSNRVILSSKFYFHGEWCLCSRTTFQTLLFLSCCTLSTWLRGRKSCGEMEVSEDSLRDSGVWQFPQMPSLAICHREKRGHFVHHHQDVVHMLWPDK